MSFWHSEWTICLHILNGWEIEDTLEGDSTWDNMVCETQSVIFVKGLEAAVPQGIHRMPYKIQMAHKELVLCLVGCLTSRSYEDPDPTCLGTPSSSTRGSNFSLHGLWASKDPVMDYDMGLENGTNHACPYSFGQNSAHDITYPRLGGGRKEVE